MATEQEVTSLTAAEEGTPAEAPTAPPKMTIEIDDDALHTQDLAHDRDHKGEHRIIEEVLDHVEELFASGAATPSGKGAKRVAAERQRVFKELEEMINAMDEKHVQLDLPLAAHDTIEAITEHMVEKLKTDGGLTPAQFTNVDKSMKHTEGGKFIHPAMGHRLAVPLIYADLKDGAEAAPDTILAFARLATDTHVGEKDNEGIRFVFLVIAHESETAVPASPTVAKAEEKHVTEAEAMAFLLQDQAIYDELLLAKDAKGVQTAITDFLQTHKAWEIGEEEKKEKKKTQNEIGLEWIPADLPFGGIKRDLKRRGEHYVSDWTDGLTSQSVAVVCFMFFACVAPAVAFGSLLDKATGGSDNEYCKKHPDCLGEECPCVGDIGVMEMLVSSGCCGIIYAIIGGSPLTVLGGTGPVLVFTGILSKFAHSMEVEFLPFYAWTGVWVGVMSLILAATDSAVLVNRVTRFTDEIFSGLISLIFTISAILDLYQIHKDGVPLLCSEGNHNATSFDELTRGDLLSIVNDEAITKELPCLTLLQLESKVLVSVVLSGGTYMIAMQLRAYRKSEFTAAWLRNLLADFGVAIAIFAMVLVRELIFTTEVDLLNMPESFEPTNGRNWWVGLGGLPFWAIMVSIFPAMMGMVLVWLDNNITYRLVNSPDHKLDKGTAYHWDTAVTGIFIAVVSLFGLPWLVAATVRSLLLCKSLATTENRNGRQRIIKVNDNRFTCFAIHCLVLLSVFLPKLLQKIPLPVIFGLFLYMGVSSMAGNTMWERTALMAIWETANYPSDSYIKKVPHRDIIKFTFVQLLALAVLYAVKSSPFGIAFPLFIAILPVIRHFTGKWGIVDEEYCKILDPEELDEDDEEAHTEGA